MHFIKGISLQGKKDRGYLQIALIDNKAVTIKLHFDPALANVFLASKLAVYSILLCMFCPLKQWKMGLGLELLKHEEF